jgi:hypothetical protein
MFKHPSRTVYAFIVRLLNCVDRDFLRAKLSGDSRGESNWLVEELTRMRDLPEGVKY